MCRFKLCGVLDTVLVKYEKYPAAYPSGGADSVCCARVTFGREYIQGEKGVMKKRKRIYVKPLLHGRVVDGFILQPNP